jgi:hypothetical protein
MSFSFKPFDRLIPLPLSLPQFCAQPGSSIPVSAGSSSANLGT